MWISSVLRSGPDLILLWSKSNVYFLAYLSPVPDFTYFESGPDEIMLVPSGFYHVSPVPDFIHFESSTDFIMLVRVQI